MNVLGICCSRKNGNTEIMMKEVFMAIEDKCDAECKMINLQDAFIRSCVGCESCMINHLKGNWDFRCVHKNGSDHFYYIEQLMREADAIIVSSPAYNLLPPGPIITFLNKMHASGDYRHVVHNNHKIGAAFSVGGTDWTNFTLGVCKMMAMEFCGSYDAVVDAAHFDFLPSTGAVLLEDDVIVRMHKLGENVAEALISKSNGKEISYVGPKGICPDCHGNMLDIKEDGVYCPQCLTKAEVTVENGELKVEFTQEEIEKNRWNPWGQELHDNNIRIGHMKAAKNKDIIRENRKKYADFNRKVVLPELVK